MTTLVTSAISSSRSSATSDGPNGSSLIASAACFALSSAQGSIGGSAPPRCEAVSTPLIDALRDALEDAAVEREPGSLGAVGNAELPVDVAEVELHRLLGDPELPADRAVREPAGERLQHRELAVGEADLVAGLRLAAVVDVDALEHGCLRRLA